jgi:uncharacterized protein
MPLFAIRALDNPESAKRRQDAYPDHRAFLARADDFGVVIKASGPLVVDDGTVAVGSLFIVEAADIETVRRFHAADPFAGVGLWRESSIDRFDLRRGGVGVVSEAG